jgi:hypothetical protein
MSNLDWLGLVLAICCGSWFGFAAVACVMSYRRRGPAPLPGALGDSPWPELDEWESEHVDSMLALFADREQFDLDMWTRQMQENA